MRAPKQIEIKGKLWKISFRKVPLNGVEGCDGLCDFGERRIYLASHLEGEDILSTLIHELTHAALFEAHLNEGSGLHSKTEEIVCDAVADMLTTLFDVQWKKKKRKRRVT